MALSTILRGLVSKLVRDPHTRTTPRGGRTVEYGAQQRAALFMHVGLLGKA